LISHSQQLITGDSDHSHHFIITPDDHKVDTISTLVKKSPDKPTELLNVWYNGSPVRFEVKADTSPKAKEGDRALVLYEVLND